MYRFKNDTLDGIAYFNGKSERIKLSYSEISNIGTKDTVITKFGTSVLIAVGSFLLVLIIFFSKLTSNL
jgi:hypothetical protein